MHLPDSLLTSTDSEQLRSFVKNLLDTVERQRVQIEQLVEENEQLRAEIRHLKKHKGKPKIRPNVADKGDDQEDSSSAEDSDQGARKSDNDLKHRGSPPRKKWLLPVCRQPLFFLLPQQRVRAELIFWAVCKGSSGFIFSTTLPLAT